MSRATGMFRGLNADAQRTVTKINASFKKMRIMAVKVGASFGTLGLIAIKLGSDFEETNNKFQTAFKGIEDKAEETAKTLSRAYSLSSTESKKLLSNTGDLLKGFGYTADGALELSNKVQEIASDLASYNNLQGGTTRASEILTKALLGERDSLVSLGIKISETDVKQRLLEKGQSKLTGQMLLSAKAQATYELILGQSGDALGDTTRSTGTFVGQMKTLKAKLSDVTTELGVKLLPSITNVVGSFNDLLDVVDKVNFKKMTKGFNKENLINKENVTDTKNWTIGLIASGVAIEILGRKLAHPLVKGLRLAHEVFDNLGQAMRSQMGGLFLWDILLLMIPLIYQRMKETLDASGLTFKDFADWVVGLWTNLIDWISGIWEGFVNGFTRSFEWMKNSFKEFGKSLEIIFRGVYVTLIAFIYSIYTTFMNVFNKISKFRNKLKKDDLEANIKFSKKLIVRSEKGDASPKEQLRSKVAGSGLGEGAKNDLNKFINENSEKIGLFNSSIGLSGENLKKFAEKLSKYTQNEMKSSGILEKEIIPFGEFLEKSKTLTKEVVKDASEKLDPAKKIIDANIDNTVKSFKLVGENVANTHKSFAFAGKAIALAPWDILKGVHSMQTDLGKFISDYMANLFKTVEIPMKDEPKFKSDYKPMEGESVLSGGDKLTMGTPFDWNKYESTGDTTGTVDLTDTGEGGRVPWQKKEPKPLTWFEGLDKNLLSFAKSMPLVQQAGSIFADIGVKTGNTIMQITGNVLNSLSQMQDYSAQFSKGTGFWGKLIPGLGIISSAIGVVKSFDTSSEDLGDTLSDVETEAVKANKSLKEFASELFNVSESINIDILRARTLSAFNQTVGGSINVVVETATGSVLSTTSHRVNSSTGTRVMV